MQNLVSSCVTNKVTEFITNPPSRTVQWISFSDIKATDSTSFGASTHAANSQQLISVGHAKTPSYYYVKGPFTDLGKIGKFGVLGTQIPAKISHAFAAIGSSGYANMLTITIPSGSSRTSTFVGSVPLGASWESFLLPVCGSRPNWLSIGTYGIVAVIVALIWWFWYRRV